MRNLSRRALAVAATATLSLGAALAASMGSVVTAGAAGSGGGGGFCGPPGFGVPCGVLNLTVASTAELSADGNTVTLTESFTCSPATNNPSNPTGGFSGFVGSSVLQVQGNEVAFGFGGAPVPSATCNGTTVNMVKVPVHPQVFGPPGSSASPPFKNGKAIAQGGGNVCQLQFVPGSPFPTATFCDFGGFQATLIKLGQ